MKRFLLLFFFISIVLPSCNKANENLLWHGPKEVSHEAQKVVFTPDKPVNVTFKVIAALTFSDVNQEQDDIESQEEINCATSQKVTIENGKQKIESDWFVVYQKNSDIIIELTECNCPVRQLSIAFDDTVTTGGNLILLYQYGS